MNINEIVRTILLLLFIPAMLIWLVISAILAMLGIPPVAIGKWINRPLDDEINEILSTHLDAYKKESYEKLRVLLNESESIDVTSSSGKTYTLKFKAYWKNEVEGDLRIIGSVESGIVRFLSRDWMEFVVKPEGEIVGELD